MTQPLQINEISELLAWMLAQSGDGDEPAQADMLQLGRQLQLDHIETLHAVKFMASRRWIDVTDLDEDCCLAQLRAKGRHMLDAGGETGILQRTHPAWLAHTGDGQHTEGEH